MTVIVLCPCCKQSVERPTLDMITDKHRLSRLERSVLEAVWRGKGHPVMGHRIIDAMYSDYASGGPNEGQAYRRMKVVLCKLRAKLDGSGIGVETVGFRQGYRLSMASTPTPVARHG